MAEASGRAGWRETWPEVIVRRQTDAAVSLLLRYYSTLDDGRPRYTGSRFESMAALNPDPDALGPADFLAVSMLSVKVPPRAAIRLLGRDAATISALLAQIPANVDIIDVDTSALSGESAAGQLWNVLRQGRDGLGPTTTSKLLAAKRPRLLPIWDSFVEKATGLGTAGYWSAFQDVLAEDDRAVWTWLGELRPYAPALPPTIPELRILDVLLWMSVESGPKAGVT